MDARKTRTRQTKQYMRGYLNEINAIAEDASKTDKDGNWGLDGWIRVFHDLIDLQVRTTAAVIQTSLAGPWWLKPTDDSVEPDTVEVPEANYPRAVSASSFVRVGLPEITIPAHNIDLEPDVLSAGETTLRIAVRDPRFVGANYTGTITLRNATNPTAKPGEHTVTVGL